MLEERGMEWWEQWKLEGVFEGFRGPTTRFDRGTSQEHVPPRPFSTLLCA